MFSTHKNIIVVVGTTGVGKTKLGVDLAKQFSGEVINCDVMQMYKGLEVATAKATQEERQGIPHHLMSFLEPHETFSPHEFRKLADAKINEITERGMQLKELIHQIYVSFPDPSLNFTNSKNIQLKNQILINV